MLTSVGADISVRVDPISGKLRRVWSTTGTNRGNPEFDDTRHHTVYTNMFTRAGSGIADETDTLGSQLPLVLEAGLRSSTPEAAVAAMEEALRNLERLGILQPGYSRAYATLPGPTQLLLQAEYRPAGALENQTVRSLLKVS